jgi:hypothetical protein
VGEGEKLGGSLRLFNGATTEHKYANARRTMARARSNGEMSRAFVNEDAGGRDAPLRRFVLPSRDDPGFDEAAALALLEGAAEGDTESAEVATGYYWGEGKLRPYVERALVRAREARDEAAIRTAERFLR